jgi:short-subunit dehydrogenase involved in D-alanine esterification of teichoic acids
MARTAHEALDEIVAVAEATLNFRDKIHAPAGATLRHRLSQSALDVLGFAAPLVDGTATAEQIDAAFAAAVQAEHDLADLELRGRNRTLLISNLAARARSGLSSTT